MLEEIRITGLGVIDDALLALGPGLTVVTGETGAGKTMVVTALGLLLGGRADSGAVRTGAPRARVEGLVHAEDLPGFAAGVEQAGGEVEDGRVVLARAVTADGRSRAFAGGAAVPVSLLSRLAEPLVAVHGQSDQQRLLRPAAQREALDRFGGPAHADLLARYQHGYRALAAVEAELEALTASARDRAREADLLRFGLAEVEAVAPTPGEDLALAAEEARLGHASSLRAAAEEAREALSSDQDQPDALGATAAARARLHAVREHDPEAGELADRIGELGYLLADVAADAASYAARLETDPARLAAVSERRAALTALTRKYGSDVEEVLAWAEQAAARLGDLDGTDSRIEELAGRRAQLRSQLGEDAARLSESRAQAAERLAAEVSRELAALALPRARLCVEVRRTGEPGPNGADEVELRLAADVASPPRPLSRGASGGELSRVMLAVEVVLAGTSPVPTFVFDEVDAGVGGRAAVEVGRRLARLARQAQVLVVTHLPQVAAYADRHVVVEKTSDGRVSTADLRVLDDGGRERELSRMLAGMAESTSALAHARELLASARRS